MAREEMVMPKMGESIMEGTVIEWKKKVGDTVELDETVLEIATDKVDSEVPAPIAGVLVEILAEEGDTVEVGTPIAIIDTDADATPSEPKESKPAQADVKKDEETKPVADNQPKEDIQKEAVSANNSDTQHVIDSEPVTTSGTEPQRSGSDGRFFSPLVRAIAKEEGISQEELERIKGSGQNNRVTKQDVLDFLKSRGASVATTIASAELSKPPVAKVAPSIPSASSSGTIQAGEIHLNRPQENVEIIKMDRMRKVIAEHMVRSKSISAHVTTFNEADVTKLVQFRTKHKEAFKKKYGISLTYTPFFIEATIQAMREFPLINSSVDGDTIIVKKDINYGIAVALGESGTGGLIVPVIKKADTMNLYGLAEAVNNLAKKARNKSLSPDDLTGGTITLTNYGSVGNLMGTPIINQPQVAIFGTGSIEKRPVVMETDEGDVIAIRHMVYLSMSYDHRIIDGALGGAFLQRVKQLLEDFDVNRAI